jgi:D-alanyl-D-alanine carboxypeptidase
VVLRRPSRLGLLSLLLAVGLASGASAAPRQLSVAAAHRIEADVNAVLHRYGVPGAAVMVLQGGRVTFVEAFGTRDAARRLPVRTQTPFEIGSITKQFTAAGILQLQEAGKLQVDRPLSDYLPAAPHAQEVTLRQLLTHTSGLHDYLDLSPQDLYRLAARPIAYDDLIARVAPMPLDFAPGSRWSYSNTGYLLLGKVIETVSGETYRDYLQRHILTPLGMTETVTTAEEARLPGVALGYDHRDGKLERAPIIDPAWASAAGFLVAPMGDLAKWDAALRGGKVISPASYRQMTTSFVTTKDGSADYGFALFLNPVYGEPRIGHTGGSLGFTTADEYFPRQDVRIIAFTNLGDSTPEAGEALTTVIFGDLYPAIAGKALAPTLGEDATITASVREAFRELQTGTSYPRFATPLAGKLVAGAGAKFVANLGPYGAPTAAIFKGAREADGQRWYDYQMQFGPGVLMPFAARLDATGSVAGFSVG